jgi:hypothetical protein
LADTTIACMIVRMSTRKHAPLAIVIFSFDRPDYLEPVLASLLAQTDLDGTGIHMFQDGAVNAFSGVRRAADEDVEACAELFERMVPAGTLHRSEPNIGECFMKDRAERHVFRELGFDRALFLEDDLVLCPWYVEVIRALLARFEKQPRVGMVGAYGAVPHWSVEQQHARRRELELLGHHWGYAFRRDCWEARLPLWDEYIELIRDCDDRMLPREAIKAWQRDHGIHQVVSTHDGTDEMCLFLAGQVKLNTMVNNATYIGSRGVHFDERLFRELGFDRTVTYDSACTRWRRLRERDIDRYHERMAERMALPPTGETVGTRSAGA